MLLLLAHTLIGLLFVCGGLFNIYHWRSLMEALIQRGVPHPWFVLPIGIAWETIAGMFIILGIFVKLAALSLIPFTIISVLMIHCFWKHHGETRALHMGIFITHFTVTLGALVLLLNTVTPTTQWIDLLH